jgi:hypothetical protein
MEYKIYSTREKHLKTQEIRRAEMLAKYEASGCRSVKEHHHLLTVKNNGDFMSYQGYAQLINRARDDRHQAQIAKKGKK